MIILCDVDGVLANFVGKVCDSIPNGKYLSTDFRSWDLRETITDEAQWSDLYQAMRRPSWCQSIPTYANTHGFVLELRKNNEVLAVTAPLANAEHWTGEREKWLSKFGFAHDEIIFCPGRHKRLIAGAVLIEDNRQTINQWVHETGGVGILVNQPWNQGFIREGVYRVGSYNEALRVIRNEGEAR